MKEITRLLATLTLVLVTTMTMAQRAKPVIPDCQGDTFKRVLSTEMMMHFNLSGINLNQYNWNNPTINCHINSAVNDLNHYQFNMKLGAYGVGLGLVGIPVGIAYNTNLGTGTGWMVFGSACLVGGVYLITRGFKRKKWHDSHVGVIGEYYRQNNIQ